MGKDEIWLEFISLDGDGLSIRSSVVSGIVVEEPIEGGNPGECVLGVFGPGFCEGLWTGDGKDALHTAKLLKSRLVVAIDHAERYGFGKIQHLNLNAIVNISEESLVEKLSDAEHKQWMYWAGAVSLYLEDALRLPDAELRDAIKRKIDAWKANFIPYQDLKDETKEYDRVWARKAIDLLAIP